MDNNTDDINIINNTDNANIINNIKNKKKNWYCYILANDYEPHKFRTYNGSTNNILRRLRQHNQELVGGARYTKKFGDKKWKIIALVTGYPDHKNTLQCEWRIRYPTGKKSYRKFRNPDGRIRGLCKVLNRKSWSPKSVHLNNNLELKMWIVSDYANCIDNNLPNNIQVNIVNNIDPYNNEYV